MTIDFHYHTVLTKRLTFAVDYLETSLAAAHKAGLDAVAMTDHFNSADYQVIHAAMRDRYPRQGDAYRVHGILAFPAMEVDVAEGPHVLVITTSEDCDRLDAALRPHHDEGMFVAADRLMELARTGNAIVVCAHPLRPGREVERIPAQVRRSFDGYGINGKDVFLEGPVMADRVRELATRDGVAVVGGSDTHHYLQAGSIRTILPHPVDTIAGLREAIEHGDHRVEIDSCLDVRVEAATLVKKTLKTYAI